MHFNIKPYHTEATSHKMNHKIMINWYALFIYCYIINYHKQQLETTHLSYSFMGQEFGHILTESSASVSLTRLQSENQARLTAYIEAQIEKYLTLNSYDISRFSVPRSPSD